MKQKSNIIYLNGNYQAIENATVSVMDRGFLFGDGVYEVIPVFNGKILGLDGHLKRLKNSLQRISLANPHSNEEWLAIFEALLAKNNGNDRAIYLQISRGVYPKRDLTIKPEYAPTIFAMVLQVTPPPREVKTAGISAITIEDFRWSACDIKSTALVANVMLRQQAMMANVDDAILIKNGWVTEGTASNVFIVKNAQLITPPSSYCLLAGITRNLIIEIAKNNAIVIQQRNIEPDELINADEIWMTSSTREIAPVIKLNGKPVGNGERKGKAGNMWKKMVDLYQQQKINPTNMHS